MYLTPLSSIEEEKLKEIYTEGQELLHHFKRVANIKEEIVKLRKGREKVYGEILALMNAYFQERGKRIFYKVTKDGKRTEINGKRLAIDPKSSIICYDEESFIEASELIDDEYLKVARQQVREQGLPAIFYLLGKTYAIRPFLSKKWYERLRKLCCKLDSINDNKKRLSSENNSTDIDLGKCRALLSKIDEEQRRIGQEHQSTKRLHKEIIEARNVLQKKYEEKKAKLQPKIQDLMREGIALDILIKWSTENPETIRRIVASKPVIENYVNDSDMTQLIQMNSTLGHSNQVVENLSKRNKQLERDLKTMEDLSKELIQISSINLFP